MTSLSSSSRSSALVRAAFQSVSGMRMDFLVIGFRGIPQSSQPVPPRVYPKGGLMDLATVTVVSPLSVRGDLSTTDDPATALGSYSPAVGDRVLVELVGKQLVVMGGFTPLRVPGEVFYGYWSSAPAGALDCDGASYVRTLYPALSAEIATGGTTFTVPLIVQGVYITGGTPGAASGSATHLLTVPEMPSHTHTQDPHQHQQLMGGALSGAAAGSGRYGSAATTGNTWAETAINNNTGGGLAFALAPKSIGMRFVIKT